MYMNLLDIKTGNMFSNTVTLKTGLPQGCVLLPSLLDCFCTNDSVSLNGSDKFFKYADDTMNEPLEQMTKEIITDFWDGGAHCSPQLIDDKQVE